MPYVNEVRRSLLNPGLEELGDFIQDVGDLNYCIARLTLRLLLRQGLKYNNINNTFGTAQLAFSELYRRVAAPYEDVKIRENGDVPEIETILGMIRELTMPKGQPVQIAADTAQAHG